MPQDQLKSATNPHSTPPTAAGIAPAVEPAPAVETMLIDSKTFARLLGVSMASFNRDKAAGKLPKHIPLSSCRHRWLRSEVIAWIEARCPPIKEWTARRTARERR